MLTSLKLKNFKSWGDTHHLSFGTITGFFGANSSGKSSILQSILALKHTVESRDRAAVLNFGDDKSTWFNLGSFESTIYKRDTKLSLSLGLEWKTPKPFELLDRTQTGESKVIATSDRLSFDVEVAQLQSKKLVVDSLKYGVGENWISVERDQERSEYKLKHDSSIFLKRTQGRAWELPAPASCYLFPEKAKVYYQAGSALSDLELEFERLMDRGIYYLGPLREYPHRQYHWSEGTEPTDTGIKGEKVVSTLLASRQRGKDVSLGYKRPKISLEERVARWLQQCGLIESFSVKEIGGSGLYEVRVKKTEASPEVLLTDVGFGVSQILPIIALCYYVPEHSTVIIEQPEIHLHPRVQSELADLFIDAAKTRKIQIIIESHSEHLLRRLQRRVAEESLNPDDLKLYFCKQEQGTSTAQPLEVDLFGTITNWPSDFFADELQEINATQKAVVERKEKAAKHKQSDK